MATSYNAQLNFNENIYSIQFETDNREYFKIVEKACQKAIDKSRKADATSAQKRTMGYL